MTDSDYKIRQLKLMLEFEENQIDSEKYGAHLSHWGGSAKSINLDEGALRALIKYYRGKNIETIILRGME